MNKGFTLIELLIVVAIIGVLSSVVLVSLSTTEDTANTNVSQLELGQLRTVGVEYKDANSGSFATFCNTDSGTLLTNSASSDEKVKKASESAETIIVSISERFSTRGNNRILCASNKDAWVAAFRLEDVDATNGENWYCVDSAGRSKEITGTDGSATGGEWNYDNASTVSGYAAIKRTTSGDFTCENN